MTDEERALHRYAQALSLVEAKGKLITIGVTTFKEYKTATLTVRFMPTRNRLDVWDRRKVLTVDRLYGSLKVITYTRGAWEDELEEAASPATDDPPDRT